MLLMVMLALQSDGDAKVETGQRIEQLELSEANHCLSLSLSFCLSVK